MLLEVKAPNTLKCNALDLKFVFERKEVVIFLEPKASEEPDRKSVATVSLWAIELPLVYRVLTVTPPKSSSLLPDVAGAKGRLLREVAILLLFESPNHT